MSTVAWEYMFTGTGTTTDLWLYTNCYFREDKYEMYFIDATLKKDQPENLFNGEQW